MTEDEKIELNMAVAREIWGLPGYTVSGGFDA